MNQTRHILMALALTGTLLIASCSKGGDTPGGAGAAKKIHDPIGFAEDSTQPGRLFAVKSGVMRVSITPKTGTLGTGTGEIWFTDYGRRQAAYYQFNNGGQANEQPVRIVGDSSIITYNQSTRQGTFINGPIDPNANADRVVQVLYLNKDVRADNALKRLPDKEVAGQTCRGYSVSYNNAQHNTWLWKKIPMYVQDESGYTTQVTQIDTGVAVPAVKFAVPADVRLTDMVAGARDAAQKNSANGTKSTSK